MGVRSHCWEVVFIGLRAHLGATKAIPVFRFEEYVLPPPCPFQQLLPLEGIRPAVAEVHIDGDKSASRVAPDESSPSCAVNTSGKPLVFHPWNDCIQWYWKTCWLGYKLQSEDCMAMCCAGATEVADRVNRKSLASLGGDVLFMP